MLSTLTTNLRDTLTIAFTHSSESNALVVFDTQSGLSRLLVDGYRAVLPDATFLDFDRTTPEAVRAAIDALSSGDLVVLVQSTSFRLNEFRFRLELFDRSLKTIEHPHLGRMPEEEYATYVDAMAYDPQYYRVVGPALQKKIDAASKIVVTSRTLDGSTAELVYDTAFEKAKPNLGDYRDMKNVGGQFPIGEVFTEPVDFSRVNGVAKLFAFGDADFRVIVPKEPVTVVIENGIIVDAPNAPVEFIAVLDQIRAQEPLWVRELGLGMNRALTPSRRLTDIGSFERMCGVHLSLGQKHTIYAKPGMPKRSSRYHVDVFVDVATVAIDDSVVFEEGAYHI